MIHPDEHDARKSKLDDVLIANAEDRAAEDAAKCDGCEAKESVKQYTVSSLQFKPYVFDYCEECAEEDRRRGFTVKEKL